MTNPEFKLKSDISVCVPNIYLTGVVILGWKNHLIEGTLRQKLHRGK